MILCASISANAFEEEPYDSKLRTPAERDQLAHRIHDAGRACWAVGRVHSDSRSLARRTSWSAEDYDRPSNLLRRSEHACVAHVARNSALPNHHWWPAAKRQPVNHMAAKTSLPTDQRRRPDNRKTAWQKLKGPIMNYTSPQSAAKALGISPKEVCEVIRYRYPGLCIEVASVPRVESNALSDLMDGRDPSVVALDGLAEFLASTRDCAAEDGRILFFSRRLEELHPEYVDRYGGCDIYCRVPSTIIRRIIEEWKGGAR